MVTVEGALQRGDELHLLRAELGATQAATDLVATSMLRQIPHVLVVDDDPGTAVAVRAVLDIGVTVVGLPDVYQALEHIERERVDLLLLELFLPGAGGADLLRRLARGSRPTHVVALTHATSVARLAPDVSVDGILHKPPVAGELRAALEVALARRTARDPVSAHAPAT